MSLVVGKMREDERGQIGASLPADHRAFVTQFVRASAIVWSAERDGHCFCIWGLMPPTLSHNAAYMWFYILEYVEHLEFMIVRHSRRAIDEALKEYPVIVGHCQLSNPRAIRWIKWLGGKFGDHEYDFVPFRIERKDG